MLIRAVALGSIGERDKSRELLNEMVKTWPQFTDAKYQLAVLDANDNHLAESAQL